MISHSIGDMIFFLGCDPMKMPKRRMVPKAVETDVLTKSKRRCCLCYHLQIDLTLKKGQIAHLDHDPSNNAEDNLAWLCLDHHDEYDRSGSQAKGMTVEELRHARRQLYLKLGSSDAAGASVEPQTADMVALPWRDLVQAVRRGEHERFSSDLKAQFLYCKRTDTFISSPSLIESITYARSHDEPFLLVGRMGTGKNVFLGLVASGGKRPRSFFDANVDSKDEARALERFFGRDGIIQNHPTDLIHFDLLQKAAVWNDFINRLLRLAMSHVLDRTDGVTIDTLNVRVVGGLTVDYDECLAQHPDSSFGYRLHFFAANQLAHTQRLENEAGRMMQLLAEILAAQVLKEGAEEETKASALSTIDLSVVQALQRRRWPDEFYGLVSFVRTALRFGSWNRALGELRS